MRRATPALLLVALVAGCGPLVQIGGNAPAPSSLLTLSAAPAPAVSTGDRVTLARAVTVTVPTVPATLQTLRLPVRIADTEVKYLATGAWVEQPSKLFQRLLIDRLNAAGGQAFDVRAGLATRRALGGQLGEFGLDVRDPARPQVRARFDAVLTGGGAPATRRFEASVPVAAQTPEEIGRALNAAANSIAGELSAWIGANG